MTDDARDAAAEASSCVALIAMRLPQQVKQISTAIYLALVEEIPELGGDDRTAEMLAASVEANYGSAVLRRA